MTAHFGKDEATLSVLNFLACVARRCFSLATQAWAELWLARLGALALVLLMATGEVFAAPQLIISKSASANTIIPQQDLIFTLSVTNTGDTPASDVVIEDLLSSNLEFRSTTGGGVFAPGSRIVSWSFPSIGPGETGSVAVVTRGLGGGLITNSATVSSNETGPVVSNTVEVVATTAPSFILGKTVSSSDAQPGDELL